MCDHGLPGIGRRTLVELLPDEPRDHRDVSHRSSLEGYHTATRGQSFVTSAGGGVEGLPAGGRVVGLRQVDGMALAGERAGPSRYRSRVQVAPPPDDQRRPRPPTVSAVQDAG